MTEDPLVVRPETNMAAAAKVLLDQKVRRLPVVDDRGRLLGIFTRCPPPSPRAPVPVIPHISVIVINCRHPSDMAPRLAVPVRKRCCHIAGKRLCCDDSSCLVGLCMELVPIVV